MTITLAIHPFKDKELPMLRLIRRQEGRRYVEVEHPGGWCMQIPIQWTNLSIQVEPPVIEGQEVRLSANGLSKLAAAVQISKNQRTNPPKTGGHTNSTRFADAPSIEERPRIRNHKTRSNKRLGNVGSQDVARKINRHGKES